MKKIFLKFILLFSFFGIVNISSADYLDLYGTGKISSVVLQKGVTNTYTIYNTGGYLYIKDITVTAINNTGSGRLYLAFCSSSPVYGELQFCKSFTKLSFNYFDNYNFSFNTLLPNSFEVRMENFPTTYTGLVKIDVNYLLFDDLNFMGSSFPNSNIDTSTGYVAVIAHQDGNLYFNEVFLEVFIIKVFIAFFALLTFLALSIKIFKKGKT